MVAHLHSVMPATRGGQLIRTEIMDPLTDGGWDERITVRTDHSVFHRSAWARVLAGTYGHRPFYLRVLVSGNEVALVPLMEVSSPLTGRRGVSLPFSDFAGPLWSDPLQDTALYQVLTCLAMERKWKHFELRGGAPPSLWSKSFHTFDAHELDLVQGIGSIEQDLPASTRRAIRKAERSGLVVRIERSGDAMRKFYQLHSLTRRRHGLPPQPYAFFEAIGHHLIDAGLGEIVLAYFGETAVAGAVFFQSGGRAIYKFGASEINDWGLRPNHLVMWRAIQHLAGMGCTSLHFGRTSTDNTGLGRFKHSWSSTGKVLEYHRFHVGKLKWMHDDEHHSESHPVVFGHLPIALNRLAGSIIYPHLD